MTMKRTVWSAGLLGMFVAVAACDFDVTNPGPVQEQFLIEPAAQPALVSGMGRALAESMNWLAYTGAAVSREIHPSGSTGSFGISQEWQRGLLAPDEVGTHWSNGQRARWLAESGISIIQEAGESQPGLLAQANLWAGYANRVLGDHMCNGVIDGGPQVAHTEYLNRAIANFTAAMSGGGDVAMAAQAGRASVHQQLGNYAAAVADANAIPDGFSYMMPYYSTEGDDQRMRLQFASAAEPYKAHSARFTWYEQYGMSDFNAAGDARMPFAVMYNTSEDDGFDKGDAATLCCGRVAWFPQQKYPDSGDDMELSSGNEMRLIEAEAMLMSGDFAGAMAKVNALRTAAGMAAETATTLDEAWGFYMREHAIENWLEGRRLPAFRRWSEQGVNLALRSPLEQIDPGGEQGSLSHLAQQDLCFPISEGEIDTNPNLS